MALAQSTNSDRLVIFKGDDTGGAFGRTLFFTIEAESGTSLDGCSAEWEFDGIVKKFDAPLVDGGRREIFYSHNETRCMSLGVRYGTFRVIDAAGKVRTVVNTKAVEVTDNVARCYPGSSNVTVRIGSWGGGGGGTDENAVHYMEDRNKTDAQKAQARANIGAMAADTPIPSVGGKLPLRALPKCLHYLAFDDPYEADAKSWYESLAPDAMGGACSAVRRGGKLYRNYDWTFDNSSEFVVRMSAAEGRHASVGVASLGSALSEDEVASGVYTAKYRALPGMTLDGINDAGVVAEINVDGGPKTGWHGDADDGGIHVLAAVRWVLDHGETAEQAAEWLADHIIQPTGEMNFHFMVADTAKTYIVENGVAHDVTDGVNVLTNYALYDAAHAGGGKERYQLLADGADISTVNFTNAYQSGNDWDSDFDSPEQHAEAISQWAAQGETKEAHRGKTTESGKAWWQSVHTTEYNFAEKTIRVAVQESGEYFMFAVDRAEAEVAVLDAAKRDLTDEKCYSPSGFTRFTWTSDDPNCPAAWLEAVNAPGAPQPTWVSPFWNIPDFDIIYSGPVSGNDGESSTIIKIEYGIVLDSGVSFRATATRSIVSVVPDQSHVLARRVASAASALAKFDADGNLVADTDTVKEIANKADEFGEWGNDQGDPRFELRWVTDPSVGWAPFIDGERHYNANVKGNEKSDAITYVGNRDWDIPYSVTFTRKRVLRTGDAASEISRMLEGIDPDSSSLHDLIKMLKGE